MDKINKKIAIFEILKELLTHIVDEYYTFEDDAQFFLTDYEDDYYIVCACEKSWVDRMKGDIGLIRAHSECKIIFQASEYPKSETRLFFLDDKGKRHLTYDQWKKAFNMGIDRFIKYV